MSKDQSDQGSTVNDRGLIEESPSGISRRDLLRTGMIGAVGLAAATGAVALSKAAAAETPTDSPSHPHDPGLMGAAG